MHAPFMYRTTHGRCSIRVQTTWRHCTWINNHFIKSRYSLGGVDSERNNQMCFFHAEGQSDQCYHAIHTHRSDYYYCSRRKTTTCLWSRHHDHSRDQYTRVQTRQKLVFHINLISKKFRLAFQKIFRWNKIYAIYFLSFYNSMFGHLQTITKFFQKTQILSQIS